MAAFEERAESNWAYGVRLVSSWIRWGGSSSAPPSLPPSPPGSEDEHHVKKVDNDSDDEEEGKLALALAMSEELTMEAAEALRLCNSRWKHARVEPPATVEAPRQAAKFSSCAAY